MSTWMQWRPSRRRARRIDAPLRRYGRLVRAAALGGRTLRRTAGLGMRAGAIRATAHSKSAVARKGLAYPSGMVVGIAAMYFLDPSQGRRRRHMSRDRALKVLRRTRREVARKARHEEGVAEGRLHEVRGDSIARPQPDDITLARKVESQIFRDADAPKGRVNVNAEHGIVYLRGQAGSQEWMERLIAAAQGVEGVKDVKNLLHVAG